VGSNSTGKVYIWEALNLSNENEDTMPVTELTCLSHGVEAVSWGRAGSSCQQLASLDKRGNLILWSQR